MMKIKILLQLCIWGYIIIAQSELNKKTDLAEVTASLILFFHLGSVDTNIASTVDKSLRMVHGT